MSNRERVRAYKEANPEATSADIARALGVAKSVVWKALNQERERRVQAEYRKNNVGKRRRWGNEARDRNRFTCPECGGPCGKGSAQRSRQPRKCDACVKRHSQERKDKITEMWHAGESLKSIAAAVNSSENAVGADMARWRREGHDLPYRRPEMRVR